MQKASLMETQIHEHSIKKVIEIRTGSRDGQKLAWGTPGVPWGCPGSLARSMEERAPIPGTPPYWSRFNSRLELARATRALVLLIRPSFGLPFHFLSSTSKALRTITAEKVVRSKSI